MRVSVNLILFSLVALACVTQTTFSLKTPKHVVIRRRTQAIEAAARIVGADVLTPVDKVAVLAPLIRTSILIETLHYAGPLLFIGLQASSLITAASIHKARSVGQLSALPFVSLFTNCVVWTLYGALRKDPTVFIPNGSGIIVALVCMYAYHLHTAQKPVGYYIAAFSIASTAITAFLNRKVHLLGLMGCTFSVLLSGSPLAVIRTVIAEKSTASLPFTTSLVIWLNNISWTLYGYIVAKDPMIFGPSLLGFILASVQISLFGAYGLPPEKKNDDIFAKMHV